jgi:hypothetical protein
LYKITKSTLVLNGSEAYTKNPETGGGVNGSKTGIFAGIWKDVKDSDVPMGFNGDGEYFEPLTQKSKDGKTWWYFIGEYDYASGELTINDAKKPRAYKVKFDLGGRLVDLTYSNGDITTFEKQDF